MNRKLFITLLIIVGTAVLIGWHTNILPSGPALPSLSAIYFIVAAALFIRPARKDKKMSSEKSTLKDTKIMIADDVQEIRQLIKIILEKHQANVTCCEDGNKAFNIAKEIKFDIILMDINMPGMDNYESVRKIRANKMNEKTHIFALTASGLLDLGNKHIEAGFDDYIEKPVKPEALVRKIKLALLKEKQQEAVNNGEEVVSYYSDDPDYRKTIENFISHLPETINGIQADFKSGKLKELSEKAHSLRGIGGMAGFPVISDKAGKIEDAIKKDHIDQQIDKLRTEINELVLLCQKTKITKK